MSFEIIIRVRTFIFSKINLSMIWKSSPLNLKNKTKNKHACYFYFQNENIYDGTILIFATNTFFASHDWIIGWSSKEQDFSNSHKNWNSRIFCMTKHKVWYFLHIIECMVYDQSCCSYLSLDILKTIQQAFAYVIMQLEKCWKNEERMRHCWVNPVWWSLKWQDTLNHFWRSELSRSRRGDYGQGGSGGPIYCQNALGIICYIRQ